MSPINFGIYRLRAFDNFDYDNRMYYAKDSFKNYISMRAVFLAIILAGLVLSRFSAVGQPSALVQSGIWAGASQKNISPSAGVFIAGHGYNRQASGVQDSLYARAVVVGDGKTHLAIVSVDCIGLLHTTLVAIRKEVASLLPGVLDTACIVMTSTHTHSGPDVVGLWGPSALVSGVNDDYMGWLVRQTAGAITDAWKNREPAIMQYAIGEHGHDWVYNISNPGAIDRSIQVVGFSGFGGRSIATMTSFACHPTIMDGASNMISADYPSGLYSRLNQKLGGVNLFLQGCIGGWVQPEYEEKTFSAANMRGSQLGDKVVQLMANAVRVDAPTVNYRRQYIQLPVNNPGFLTLSKAGVIKREIGDSVMTEIAWFNIGDAVFATHPGETTPVHGQQTKALMKNRGPKIVVGLAMDALGYILSEEFFSSQPPLPHTEYLLSMSVHPEAGKTLMQKIILLASLSDGR